MGNETATLSRLTKALCSTERRQLMLSYFYERTTNSFTEGYHTKIKMLEGVSCGLRNVDVYWRIMLLEFVSSPSSFRLI